MCRERIEIAGIPAIIWGKPSDRVWLCVHGKMSSKDAFEYLAEVAEENGCQTVSFDLPQHGERTGEGRRCDIWNGIKDLEAGITFSEHSEHPFMTEKDLPVVEKWLYDNIR